jgi:type II secretory pathway pseudopilin PulG
MKCRAFTIVEILVGAAISSILAVAIFALMNVGMILSAKNLSLNLTSNSMRTALDRVEQVVQQGDTMPELINTAGTVVATGPAAGIKFDRAVGSPYVVTVSGGTIPAATTSLTLTRSTHPVASPPVPTAGDVVRIATTATTLRPRIQSVVSGAVNGQARQPFTVTFEAALGTTVTPVAATIVTAELVRNVAFLVMPANGKPELRYYGSFDTTTNLNDPTKYVVVTDQIGTAAADATPFSLVMSGAQSFVSFSLRVRASNNDRGIRGQQRDQFNTYSRTETLIRPKTIP